MGSQDSPDHFIARGKSNLEKITDCLEDPDAFVRRAALDSIPILFKDGTCYWLVTNFCLLTESILEKHHDRVLKVIPKVMTCLSDSDDTVNRLAGNVLDEFKQGKILVKLSRHSVRILSSTYTQSWIQRNRQRYKAFEKLYPCSVTRSRLSEGREPYTHWSGSRKKVCSSLKENRNWKLLQRIIGMVLRNVFPTLKNTSAVVMRMSESWRQLHCLNFPKQVQLPRLANYVRYRYFS